jgi:hypothetical protein
MPPKKRRKKMPIPPEPESTFSPSESRACFRWNAWAERGHALDEFRWTSSVVDGKVLFQFHLETVAYDAEDALFEAARAAMSDAEREKDDDSRVLWNNYNSAIIDCARDSPGFSVFPVGKAGVDELNGLEVVVDPLPPAFDGPEGTPEHDKAVDEYEKNRIFNWVYTTGHNGIGDNRIKFERVPGTADKFNIRWTGRHAEFYCGSFDFDRKFEICILDVKAPQLGPNDPRFK